jgi:Fe-S-cluster-containing dehydrogenase component
MSRNGLLIDYKYCTGCHSCEIACKNEHNLPSGKWGIKINVIGPWLFGPDKWEFDYIPAPTSLCDLCIDRIAGGKKPSCVHHCLAQVIEYGPVEELVRKIGDKPKMVMYTP